MATHNHKGLTLLELLIIVVIIAILAAFAIPRFAHANDKRTCKKVVSAIVKAEENYFLKHAAYTTDRSSLELPEEIKKLLNTSGLSVTIQQSPMNPQTFKVTATKGRVQVTGYETGPIEIEEFTIHLLM